ncbi:MAG TPA: PilZ domain-containing protein [Pseudomonas xinjiangensis]|uniref:PilZ domain-containing protein n=2 Tax=root TaxID=1 RepID=A0A7V1BPZ5_9GAMM|nr:PilZ domain-containing protein [Halopseudomonas xinjiangensis]HEC48241.1 PilZ domain-containing protein [Halopseudomonas xinjiangensis]
MQPVPFPGGERHTEQRRIARHQLAEYLSVYNAYTGRPMGQIGNISDNGMMLISLLPVMVGEVFDMQLRLPSATASEEVLNFKALSHWSRPDISPGHFDTGFSIVANGEAFSHLARLLERYFSFSHSLDA